MFFVRLLLLNFISGALFASLLTDYASLPDPGVVSNFLQPAPGYVYTKGPQEVGNGVFSVIFTSTLDLDFSGMGSILGDTSYGLGKNGSLGGGVPFAGLNFDITGYDGYSMRFAFATPVRGVVAYMNYRIPNDSEEGVFYGPVLLTAFDSSNNQLEQWRIDDGVNDISTPSGNGAGAWRGILRSSPDIAAIEFANAGVVLHSLTIAQAPGGEVPEPGGLAAAGLGLILIYHRIHYRGRRRSK